jgi:hypothetical protein
MTAAGAKQGRRSRAVLTRRILLAAGVPVSAFVALCAVASVSVFPPAVHSKSLKYALAKTLLYVGPSDAFGNTQPKDVPQQFIDQSIVLAFQMASPELRQLIAAKSGIAARRIAVDGPVDLNESVFEQEPDGPKRATQILVQNAPYRVTVDEDLVLPEIGVTAQAPTPGQAVRLASGVQAALSAYLTGLETTSQTPVAERLDVSALGPVFVTDGSSGDVVNIALLTSLLAFTLWCGLVFSVTAIVRDIRRLRGGWTPGRASLRTGHPLDLH